MAKVCFCGCGRTVPRFPLGVRSINRRGQLVSERLAWGQQLAGEQPEIEEWLEDGRSLVRELREVVHGEAEARSVSEERVRHWQVYGRGMERVAVGMGLPSIREWLRSNPQAPQKVARAAAEG